MSTSSCLRASSTLSKPSLLSISLSPAATALPSSDAAPASRSLFLALDLHVIAEGATMRPPILCSHAAVPGSSRSSSGVALKSPAMTHGPPYKATSSPAVLSISKFRAVAPSAFHKYAEMRSIPPLRMPSTHATASLPRDSGGDMSKDVRPVGCAIPICPLVAMAVPLQPLCPLPSTAGAPCMAHPIFLAACCRSAHLSPAAWCSWQQIAATSSRSSHCPSGPSLSR